jgi:alpha-ribazole phosphatase
MTRILLVRHGETAWNAERRFQGVRDVPLNATGRLQAHAVARALAGRAVDLLTTSDLSRAAETAAILAGALGLAPRPDPRLREMDFGDWEGLTIREVARRWPDESSAWGADPAGFRAPGGESMASLLARVGEVLAATAAACPDGTAVLVAHGGSLRAAVATALGTDLRIFRRVRLDNGSITTIQVRDGRCLLAGLNDTSHLREGERGVESDVGAGPAERG